MPVFVCVCVCLCICVFVSVCYLCFRVCLCFLPSAWKYFSMSSDRGLLPIDLTKLLDLFVTSSSIGIAGVDSTLPGVVSVSVGAGDISDTLPTEDDDDVTGT